MTKDEIEEHRKEILKKSKVIKSDFGDFILIYHPQMYNR